MSEEVKPSLVEQLKQVRDTVKETVNDIRDAVNPKLEAATAFIGEDAKAWLRQGMAELREAFNPSPESVAQPVPYGALGQPPPSLVTHDVLENGSVYSMEALKQAGQEANQMEHHREGHGR